MKNVLRNRNRMNIVGQGGKIILFSLPSLLAAILVQTRFPRVAALPGRIGVLRLLGYVLLVPGLLMWGAAVVQLIGGFSKGKLVTTGAYGIVRNPIYASVTFFVLPGITLITSTWVYLVVSLFLYTGVMLFIGREEEQLGKVFGKEYEEYLRRVDRMIPWRKP